MVAAWLRDRPGVLCLKTIRETLIFHMKLLYSVFVLVLIIGFVWRRRKPLQIIAEGTITYKEKGNRGC